MMNYEEFAALVRPYIIVSHETFIKLETYVELLTLWQSKINLISSSTIETIWMRHILDSMQLIPHVKTAVSLADLGSGAGLPGLILSIATGLNITLVESDQRKAAFLQEAKRITAATAIIHSGRVEDLDERYHIVTARAFAPLAKLLAYAQPILSPNGTGVFLKGRDLQAELSVARQDWQFDEAIYPSLSDAESAILIVSDLRRR